VLDQSARLSVPVAYAFAGVGVLFGFLSLSLAWIPVRFWAQPPVKIQVREGGLKLWDRSGVETQLNWTLSSVRLELLVRSGDGQGTGPSDRIWVAPGTRALRLPWRPLIPLIYTTRDGAKQLLSATRAANLSVTRRENGKAVTMRKSGNQEVYSISS
jgi:hypothetical protein